MATATSPSGGTGDFTTRSPASWVCPRVLKADRLYRDCLAGLSPAAPAFVGRRAEVARATAVLRGARDGEVTVIVVRGAAGIGKSAFARQLARFAAQDGWHVALGTAAEVGGPYVLVGQLARQLLGHVPGGLGGLPERARVVLTEVVGGSSPRHRGAGPITRHQIAGAIGRLCDRLDDGGVLLVVDEAHRLDEGSTDVLMRLLSGDRRPVIVVVAYRPELVGPVLAREVRRLNRASQVVEIDIGPLTRDEAQTLALAAVSAPRAATDVSAILDAAEGNPLLVQELARCVGDNGELAVVPSTWEAIATRLLDLDEPTTDLLQRLAVAGDDFDTATVVAFTGLPDQAAFEFLDAAIAAGALLVSKARYRFRYELIRQALAASLPSHRRIAIHRDAARGLADAGADPALVAHHWLAGQRPADAVQWLLAAARRAVALGAFAAADGHLRRLLAYEPEHVDALVMHAEVLDALGDLRAADAYAAAARAAGEPRSHEIRPRQALALLKAGDPHGALAILHDAQPRTSVGRISQALTLSGAAVIGLGDVDLATVKAEEARRYAARARDPGALVEASWAASLAAHARGELPDRLLADLLATRNAPDLAVRVFDGHLCATERLLYGTRPYAQVIDFATSLAGQAERLGAARGQAFALTLRGQAHLLAGRLADADADLAEGARLHHAIAAAAGESLSLQRQAQLAYLQDRPADAARHLADALAAARESDLGHHLFDRIYGTRIALSAPGRAAAAIEEAEVSVCGPAETCPACRITLTVPAAIGAARSGDLDRAESYAQASQTLATVMLRQPGWYASVDEVRAHCTLAHGDHDRARERFAKAAEAFRAAGQPLDSARCRTWQKAC